MESVFYDFHIHSALSPCADKDMTPNNIVGMAKLKELDIIAITDHNSCGNCAAAMEAGKAAGLKVIPGMELCTAEEVHILCLFSELSGALSFWEYVKSRLPKVRNRPELFGSQFLLDADDNIIGEENTLLLTAADIRTEEVSRLVKNNGGIALPAHIDRTSYSVLASLGFITDEMEFSAVEISKGAGSDFWLTNHSMLDRFEVLKNSDAHHLWEISERENSLKTGSYVCANLLKLKL